MLRCGLNFVCWGERHGMLRGLLFGAARRRGRYEGGQCTCKKCERMRTWVGNGARLPCRPGEGTRKGDGLGVGCRLTGGWLGPVLRANDVVAVGGY
jgi:hypothetical protein